MKQKSHPSEMKSADTKYNFHKFHALILYYKNHVYIKYTKFYFTNKQLISCYYFLGNGN